MALYIRLRLTAAKGRLVLQLVARAAHEALYLQVPALSEYN